MLCLQEILAYSLDEPLLIFHAICKEMSVVHSIISSPRESV
jgi:hypothetical protein